MPQAVSHAVPQNFHVRLGSYVSEIIVLHAEDAVQPALENLRARFAEATYSLVLPMLFLFSQIHQSVSGLLYSAMVAGADYKGVRFFEPAPVGMCDLNRSMAKSVRQFLVDHSVQLKLGVVDEQQPDQWHNHWTPQPDDSGDDMRSEEMLCASLLTALWLHFTQVRACVLGSA